MFGSCRNILVSASLTGALLASAGLSSACSEAPKAGDCAKLFEHIVSMQVAKSKASDADKAKGKAALQSAKRDSFVERCETNIKAAQVTCSLAAKTMADFDACDNQG